PSGHDGQTILPNEGQITMNSSIKSLRMATYRCDEQDAEGGPTAQYCGGLINHSPGDPPTSPRQPRATASTWDRTVCCRMAVRAAAVMDIMSTPLAASRGPRSFHSFCMTTS